MNFHVAMETFAEAWIVANIQNYTNSKEIQTFRYENSSSSELSTMNTEDNHEGGMSASAKCSNKRGTIKLQNSSHDPFSSALSSTPAVRSYPIHCIVEQGNQNNDDLPRNVPDFPPVVLCDAFAILPGSTLFSDILRTSLIKIGFSPSEAVGAKGTIQIRNWKPIPFEYITDDPNSTVEEIFGDISSNSTLRILLTRVDLDNIEWNDQAVRYAVVRLLREVNQITLAKLCPLPQPMISNIANSKYSARICMEKCKEFGEWYKEYRKEHKEGCNSSGLSPNTRLTFHPIYELPKLRQWYKSCPNPTNNEFKHYLDELNRSSVRQERIKVPLRCLKIWWRNEKQRLKRIQAKKEERLNSLGGKDDGDNIGASVTADIIEPMLAEEEEGEGEEEADCNCSPVSETDVELTQKRGHKGKNGRVATQPDYSIDQQSFGPSVHNGVTPLSFQANSSKTFSSEMNSLSNASQHPVYINGISDVGFHLRYLNDHPTHGSQNDTNLPSSSSRCHLPLSGLRLHPPSISHLNSHVYHLSDNLYSPAFLPCSAGSNTHGGSGNG